MNKVVFHYYTRTKPLQVDADKVGLYNSTDEVIFASVYRMVSAIRGHVPLVEMSEPYSVHSSSFGLDADIVRIIDTSQVREVRLR